MSIATNHLGSTTPSTTYPFLPTPTPTLLLTWDAADTVVGTWFENTQVENYPTESQTVNCILNLEEVGIYIPHNRDNLTKCWHARKHHRDAVLLTPDEIGLTDTTTERDRKRLYQQMNKHFSSPVVTVLRLTDGSLKPNLRTTLNTYRTTTPHFQHAHDADFTDTPQDPRLEHLLVLADEEEVLRNIRDSPLFTPLSSVLSQYNPGTLIP